MTARVFDSCPPGDINTKLMRLYGRIDWSNVYFFYVLLYRDVWGVIGWDQTRLIVRSMVNGNVYRMEADEFDRCLKAGLVDVTAQGTRARSKARPLRWPHYLVHKEEEEG